MMVETEDLGQSVEGGHKTAQRSKVRKGVGRAISICYPRMSTQLISDEPHNKSDGGHQTAVGISLYINALTYRTSKKETLWFSV